MAITFEVDDVAKSSAAPPTRALREHLGEVLAFGGDGACRVLAGSHVVEDRGTMRSVIESTRQRADARYEGPEQPQTTGQPFFDRFGDAELQSDGKLELTPIGFLS